MGKKRKLQLFKKRRQQAIADLHLQSKKRRRQITSHYVISWIIAIYMVLFLVNQEINIFNLATGWLFGLGAGIISAYYELNIFPQVKQNSYAGKILLYRGLFYTVMIIVLFFIFLVTTWSLGLYLGEESVELTEDNVFNRFFSKPVILSLVLLVLSSFVISFIRQISRMLGPGVLRDVLTGKYVTPVEEERIFMFLDLKNSTAIAQDLGAEKYNRFKNEFFYDIVEPVLQTKGTIYQYVGDEVIVTWKSQDAGAPYRMVKCFYLINDKINNLKERYIDTYKYVPEFRAGAHGGTVVTAEVGDLKKEIVHSGDAINVTSRLEAIAKNQEQELLVSSYILKGLNLPPEYELKDLGKANIRGITEPLEVYGISRH